MKRIITRESSVIFIGVTNRVIEYWGSDGWRQGAEHLGTKKMPSTWEPTETNTQSS